MSQPQIFQPGVLRGPPGSSKLGSISFPAPGQTFSSQSQEDRDSFQWRFCIFPHSAPTVTQLEYFLPFAGVFFWKQNKQTYTKKQFDKNWKDWTSLVVQCIRICLLMQGTWVQSLIGEDSICFRATKPVNHNYWTHALGPASCNYWALEPRAWALQQEKPPRWEDHTLQWRVASVHYN